MKNQILSAVNGRIQVLQKTVERVQTLMQENYRHFFCYESKETYKAYYLLEKYNELKDEVERTDNPDELRNIMKDGTDFYLGQLTNQALYASTTNQMVNLGMNVEKEAAHSLYKFYSHLRIRIETNNTINEIKAKRSKSGNPNLGMVIP